MRLLFVTALLVAGPAFAREDDPSIVRVGETYYLSNYEKRLRSTDLSTWTAASDLPTPTWAKPTLWAPQLYVDDKAWFYYTNMHGENACIGVATGSSAESTDWKDVGEVVCTQKTAKFGSQEPFVVAERGLRYLVWKENGELGGKPAWLLFQALDKTGTKLTGDAREILDNDTKWEGNAIDSPTLLRRDAWIYLVYAGKGGLGVARAPSINGPWVKALTNPLVKGASKPTLFTTPKNEVRLLYVAGGQSVISTITFDKELWPHVEKKSTKKLPPLP